MRLWKKTVLGTASVFLATAGLTGLGSMTPLLAGDAPESIDSTLLPPEVLEAALAEEAALATVITAPDETTSKDDAVNQPARSLSALVSDNLGRTPRDREEECLAIAVYYESKSESLSGQLAVAEVVINRTESRKFPGTVCGVVTQHRQFSFVQGGRLPSVNRDSRNWQEAVAIARIARDELAQSGVGDALYFHARRVSPGWAMTRVATIGNHIFYR